MFECLADWQQIFVVANQSTANNKLEFCRNFNAHTSNWVHVVIRFRKTFWVMFLQSHKVREVIEVLTPSIWLIACTTSFSTSVPSKSDSIYEWSQFHYWSIPILFSNLQCLHKILTTQPFRLLHPLNVTAMKPIIHLKRGYCTLRILPCCKFGHASARCLMTLLIVLTFTPTNTCV